MNEPRLIEAVAGIIVWTERLAPMLAFYRDILRLPVHSIHPDFAAFELQGMRISVGLHSQVRGETREPHRVMVNLGVADIQTSYTALRAQGVEFIRSPEPEAWGGWVATFRDPDGNLLQLLQQAPRGA